MQTRTRCLQYLHKEEKRSLEKYMRFNQIFRIDRIIVGSCLQIIFQYRQNIENKVQQQILRVPRQKCNLLANQEPWLGDPQWHPQLQSYSHQMTFAFPPLDFSAPPQCYSVIHPPAKYN